MPRQRGHDGDGVDAAVEAAAAVAVAVTVEGGGGGRAALEGDLEVGEGRVHVVLTVVLARLRHVRLQPHLQLKERGQSLVQTRNCYLNLQTSKFYNVEFSDHIQRNAWKIQLATEREQTRNSYNNSKVSQC